MKELIENSELVIITTCNSTFKNLFNILQMSCKNAGLHETQKLDKFKIHQHKISSDITQWIQETSSKSSNRCQKWKGWGAVVESALELFKEKFQS